MSQSTSAIGRLFGGIWSVVVTLYKVLVILSLVIFGFTLWAVWSGPKQAKIEDNVALIVAPTGSLVDQRDVDPARALLDQWAGTPPPQTAVRDVVRALELGAEDPRIAFVVLKLDGLWGAGLPQVNEVIAAVQAFRATGKRVVAYSAWYDQAGYLAASHSDEIVMDPLGMVGIEGLSSYPWFYKELADKLGVQFNIFRVGEYKSAAEPFSRTSMSEEAKAANRAVLGDLWKGYTEHVAQGRALAADAVNRYVETLPEQMEAQGGDWAALALSQSLVTHVEPLAGFRARMAEQVGVDERHGSFRQIHFFDYLGAREAEIAREGRKAPEAPVIARVVVQGEIVNGRSEIGVAGGDTIAELLDEARRDDSVAGVLLRVDSPGGSVWASEQIRRVVAQLREEGKPVVVSMGNLAASGGYWISMNADRIYAHPETITGSIGVIGLVPTFDQGLAKIGVRSDGVGTTSMAGAFRTDRPLSSSVRRVIQSSIEHTYGDFVSRVAEARGQPVEAIDRVARGRVWSGTAALEHGLVDALGQESDALQALVELTGLEAWKVEDFSPSVDPFQQLLSRFGGGMSRLMGPLDLSESLQLWLGRVVPDPLRSFDDPRGEYAHCLCSGELAGRAAGR